MYENFSIKEYENIYWYLENYKSILENKGYKLQDIDLITVDELNNTIKKINGDGLPLGEWKPREWNTIFDEDDRLHNYLYTASVGSIKDYVDDKYDWIWGTTYWTRTATYPAINGVRDLDGPDANNGETWVYFVDTQGDLCATSLCFSDKIAAGIRPVVTIANKDISYIIETKTDGNGTIKASKTISNGGEEITFTVTPKEGYVLGEVKVTDAEGNVVTFTDYTFTMPNANVLIEATFVPKNPNTKVFLTIIPIIVFIVSAVVYFKSKTKVYNI